MYSPYSNPYNNPYANPHPNQYANPYSSNTSYAQPSSSYAAPTPPEKIPIETSHFTFCPTCNKNIWTHVRKVRGGLGRNPLTDAFFKTVTLLVVQYDTGFEHSCPDCGSKFKIYRMVGHRSRHSDGRGSVVVVKQQQPPPPHQVGGELDGKGRQPSEMEEETYKRREMEGNLGGQELERNERAAELDDTERTGPETAEHFVFPKDVRQEWDRSFVVSRPLQAHVDPALCQAAAAPNPRIG